MGLHSCGGGGSATYSSGKIGGRPGPEQEKEPAVDLLLGRGARHKAIEGHRIRRVVLAQTISLSSAALAD